MSRRIRQSQKRAFQPALEAMEPITLMTTNGAIVESLTQAGAFTINGSAAITASGARMTNALNQHSSVWFNNLLTANQYTASFNFSLSNPGGIGWADGFTFAVADSTKTSSTDIGAGGGYLGYKGLSGYAIEFDTFYNGPSFGDPKYVHVGLDVGGNVDSIAVSKPLPFNIEGAGIITASITYASGNITVSIAKPGGPTYQVLSATVPKADIPATGRVGLTAGTAAGRETAYISDFDFYPQLIAMTSFAKDEASTPLYSNGNYDGSYIVNGSTLPNNPKLTLGVYWATGPTAADIIGSPVYTAPLSQTVGTHDFTVKMANLVFPPINAEYLVAILDNQHVLSAGEENKNVAAIGSDVLQAPLSYELDSLAPSLDVAVTREQRVFFWLAQYSSTINATASMYGLDPCAIAGAIAWEALQNAQGLGQVTQLYGPGKIHPSGDAVTVEGTKQYGPYLPVQANLASYLLDPTHAITYIAAIMNAYAVDAAAVGINLRGSSGAGILTSYYNGVSFNGSQVTLLNAANYFASRVKTISTNPLAPNATMGQWVANNLDYLGDALGNI